MSRHRERPELPPGYSYRRQARSGHWEVLRPDGERLRQENGMPVHVAFSPSDWRSRKHEAVRIRKAISNLESQVRSNDD